MHILPHMNRKYKGRAVSHCTAVYTLVKVSVISTRAGTNELVFIIDSYAIILPKAKNESLLDILVG